MDTGICYWFHCTFLMRRMTSDWIKSVILQLSLFFFSKLFLPKRLSFSKLPMFRKLLKKVSYLTQISFSVNITNSLCLEMIIVSVTPWRFKNYYRRFTIEQINIQQFSKLSRQPNTLLHIKCGLSTERKSPSPPHRSDSHCNANAFVVCLQITPSVKQESSDVHPLEPSLLKQNPTLYFYNKTTILTFSTLS